MRSCLSEETKKNRIKLIFENPTKFFTKQKEEISVLTQKCETEQRYIPLKHRTKSLLDLSKHDTTEDLKKFEESSERYKKKREKIMEERQKN